jgi:hypothetical protein
LRGVTPSAALQGSEAALISLSEVLGDALRGIEHLGLPAPVVPRLPEFFPVLLDLNERDLEARQLSFSRRQLRR